ncbi:MAG: recombinase family protein [Ruminococcus flavefaciens]|nr:recombinase family protein [Ruminococcus flavefaciens]
MKRIAACYIRVSTDEQTELSPETQLIEIKKYADEHGYYIPDEFIFKDEGISGRTTAKRPEFNRMISVARQKPKPFDALLMWKFSRFARNRTDAVVYKNLLRNQCGIDVISISENIGEDKGASVILEAMFEAMDEYYSINLSTEVKRSMKVKAEKGEPTCKAPFGYINKDKTFAIQPEQAAIVKEMFNMFENGIGLRKIATHMTNLGVKTNRGNAPSNRWVEYILMNPVYTGKIRWTDDNKESNKHRYKNCETNITQGHHEAIITQKQFDRVNTLLAEQKLKYAKYQRNESPTPWMLRGLIRCNTCGATLIRIALHATPTLQCHNYARGQCQVSHSISERKINQIIINALEDATASLNFELIPLSATSNESDVTQKMLEAEKRKLQKVRTAYEEGVDTLEEYKENKQRITQNINRLQSELKKTSPAISKKEFSKKITDVLKVVTNPTIDVEAKNQALRSIIQKIVFVKPTNEIRITFYT